MGSAFLCAALGIMPTVRHADYIGSWLEGLREDNRAIFRAAGAASKAAEWLLSRHREANEDLDIEIDMTAGDEGSGENGALAPAQTCAALERRAA